MIDKVIKQNIVKDLKNKIPVKDVVIKYGVSRQNVYHLMEKHKITYDKRKCRQYSESFINNILNELKYDTQMNIGKKYGIPIRTIQVWVKKEKEKEKEKIINKDIVKVVPKKIQNSKKRDDILRDIRDNVFVLVTYFEWDELRVKGFEDLDVLTLKVERIKKSRYRLFEFISFVSDLKKRHDVSIIIKEFK